MLDNIKYTDDIDIFPESISDEDLIDSGIDVEILNIREENFNDWICNREKLTSYTRLIRYYLSTYVLQLGKQDTVLDVGSGDDIYNSVIAGMVRECTLNDVSFQKDISCNYYSGNIVGSKIVEKKYSVVNVGHAFEHFKDNEDTLFVESLPDLLMKGGRACIEPLFVGKNYLEVFSYKKLCGYDASAKAIFTQESGFPGKQSENMGFARIYDVAALKKRVLLPIINCGMTYNIYSFMQNSEYLPDMSRYQFKRKNINYPLRILLIGYK